MTASRAGSKALAQGATTWTGGQFRGAWELSAGHTLTVLDGGAKQLVAVDLVNNGTMLWQSTDDLYGGSSTLTNNGLFEAQANSRWSTTSATGRSSSTTARCAPRTASRLTNLSFALVNNAGTLDAGAGGAIVYDGGANVFNAGTKFTGAGRNIVVSDARFVDDYSAANLVLQSGIFYGGDGITRGLEGDRPGRDHLDRWPVPGRLGAVRRPHADRARRQRQAARRRRPGQQRHHAVAVDRRPVRRQQHADQQRRCSRRRRTRDWSTTRATGRSSSTTARCAPRTASR